MPVTKEPPSWVQLQNKTMIRWINQKLAHIAPETPQLPNAPTTIASFADLHDGLVLIRLVNQMVFEVISNPKHPMNRSQLYYIKPLYPRPSFKLHKLENLADLLQFVKMILNINVSGISADNIHDGDHKLILGFVWSLFLFDSAASFSSFSSSAPSLVEIKSMLSEWINRCLSKRKLHVANFNKDWSIEINRPDLILSALLSHYDIHIPANDPNKKLHNLAAVLAYAEDSLAVPHLIDIDDFKLLVPDEKCIITYLIEWFKALELSSPAPAAAPALHDDAVLLVIDTVKHKNKYETLSLRFLNRSNRIITQLSSDVADTRYLADANSLVEEVRSVAASVDFAGFSALNSKLDSLLNTLDGYKSARMGIIADLIYHNYPELLQYYCLVKSTLDTVDLLYCPSIKLLSLDHLSVKLNQLIELDASMLALSKEMIRSLEPVLASSAQSSSAEAKQLQYVRTQLLKHRDALDHEMPLTTPTGDPIVSASCGLSPALFKQFTTHLASSPALPTHFELSKLVKGMVSSDMDSASVDALMRLIPTKAKATLSSSSSSNSISDSDFRLNTASSATSLSDEDDFIFDEIQQKLDSQLSGTGDKVYDVHEFVSRLENGFNV